MKHRILKKETPKLFECYVCPDCYCAVRDKTMLDKHMNPRLPHEICNTPFIKMIQEEKE